MSRRAVLNAVVAAVVVAAVVAGGSASFSASASPPGGVTVVAGDSLWGLAAAHGITVAQLAAANQMSPTDLLLIGRHLSIPQAEGPGASTPSPTQSPTPGSAAAATTAASQIAAAAYETQEAEFCTVTTFYQGPSGQIPSLLADSPGRLALRPVMETWAETYGVAPALVEAVAWQESGWQQGVVSPDGAVGIGQVMPATGSFVDSYLVGVNLNVKVASDNIRMEAAYLAYLIRQVGNSPCRVAAAYYEGPAAVSSVGVFGESDQYVRDVVALESEFN
jgi:soluble lytic murein transglycosylase-like protein